MQRRLGPEPEANTKGNQILRGVNSDPEKVKTNRKHRRITVKPQRHTKVYEELTKTKTLK